MLKQIILTLSLLLSLGVCAQQTFPELLRRANDMRREGHFQSALPLYEQAEVLMNGQRVSQKVSMLNGMASCLTELGEYDRAADCYDRLDVLYRESGSANVVNILNRSNVLLLTGQYSRVTATLEPLDCPTLREQLVRRINLAYAYSGLGLYERALSMLSPDSVDVPSDDVRTRFTLLNNRGFILQQMGRYDEAAAVLRSAVKLVPADRADHWRAESNLALVTTSVSLIDECIQWYATTYGTSHPDYALCLRKKAEMLLRQQQSGAAIPLLKQYFSLRRDYIIHHFLTMSTQQRLNFWASERELLRLCYSVEAVDPDFLYDVALFSKSVMLQSNAVFLRLKSLSTDDQTLYERLEVLRGEANGATGAAREVAEHRADSIERLLMKRINRDGQYERELTASQADVARKLKADEAAVEFVRYQRIVGGQIDSGLSYAALVLHRGQTRFVQLFSQSEIEDFTLSNGKSLAHSIASHRSSDKNALFSTPALGELIWGKICAQLPAGCHIYFSAEGLLNNLGIEYLTDHPCSRLSSTRQIADVKPSTTRPSGTGALVVGGIDYNDASQSRPTLTVPDRSGSRTFALDNHLPSAGNRFSFLPGSRAEADSICAIVADHRHFTGAAATEAVMKQAMQEAQQVHISTHGVAYGLTSTMNSADVTSSLFVGGSSHQDLSLSRCGIVLAGVNKTSSQTAENSMIEDGILTARELCDLDLSGNRLTVLSACQTGLGNTEADGLVGLPQGLKRAGAGAVVVSLWPVDDKATQLFMTYFYEALNEQKGRSPEQALRSARERLRSTSLPVQQTIRSFDPGTLTNKVRVVDTTRSFDQPYYYNAFIIFDGTK